MQQAVKVEVDLYFQGLFQFPCLARTPLSGVPMSRVKDEPATLTDSNTSTFLMIAVQQTLSVTMSGHDAVSTLTIRTVCLPEAAAQDLVRRGLAASTGSAVLNLQYRRTCKALEVYVADGEGSFVEESKLLGPFQSTCTAKETQDSFVGLQWLRIARFDDVPAVNVTASNTVVDARGSVGVPGGLCHPHIHLDKCFLLDRCQISDGTFDEAMTQTGRAKAEFDHADLMTRGSKLILNSVSHGVTTMRAHVEVDPTVGLLCVEAGIALKRKFRAVCDVQLVAFAQDPLYYPDDPEKEDSMAKLLDQAASMNEIDALGSAPYVESSAGKPSTSQYARQKQNIDVVIRLASLNEKDVDFHLDYDLDPESSPMTLYAMEAIRKTPTWSVKGRKRRITLGHCTKLSVLPDSGLDEIHAAIPQEGDDKTERSPVSFVGLPPSDVYMQGRSHPYASRPRATLPLLQLADQLGVCCALGVNNVANLFTPQGDADPLAMLPWAVALYQDATQCEGLLSFISTDARYAGGFAADYPALWKDLVIFDTATSVQQAVFAPPFGRIVVKNGQLISKRTVTFALNTPDLQQ